MRCAQRLTHENRKGTQSSLQPHIRVQPLKLSTPGYPPSGESDLMKYYETDRRAVPRSDRRMLTLAEEQNVKRLIWLSDIAF